MRVRSWPLAESDVESEGTSLDEALGAISIDLLAIGGMSIHCFVVTTDNVTCSCALAMAHLAGDMKKLTGAGATW